MSPAVTGISRSIQTSMRQPSELARGLGGPANIYLYGSVETGPSAGWTLSVRYPAAMFCRRFRSSAGPFERARTALGSAEERPRKQSKHEARALPWARRDMRARAAVATIAACPMAELAIPHGYTGVFSEGRARALALADELEDLGGDQPQADAPARWG